MRFLGRPRSDSSGKTASNTSRRPRRSPATTSSLCSSTPPSSFSSNSRMLTRHRKVVQQATAAHARTFLAQCTVRGPHRKGSPSSVAPHHISKMTKKTSCSRLRTWNSRSKIRKRIVNADCTAAILSPLENSNLFWRLAPSGGQATARPPRLPTSV